MIQVTFGGFAAIQRQTVVLKTLKKWSALGWLPPAPRGTVEMRPHQRTRGTLLVNTCASRNLLGLLVLVVRCPPFSPIIFRKKFVEKFPRPSPSPGVHHVWNVSRPPKALSSKKIWGPQDPPRRRYEGQNFNFPPPPQGYASRDMGVVFTMKFLKKMCDVGTLCYIGEVERS